MSFKKWTAPLALMLAFAVLMVPTNVQASVLGGAVYLYDNGVDEANATTDFQFYVGMPDYLSLDQDYWNFTVWGRLVNNTGAAVGDTFVVTIYINDGTTNLTANSGNLVLTNTSTSHVDGNISIAAASFASLTAVDNGTLYITLTNGADVNDTYASAVVISDTYVGGIISWVIPMMISLFAIGIIFAMFSKIMGQASKMGKKKR